MNYIKTKTYEELSKKGAALIAAQIIMKPDCVLGLATGSSPIGIYKNLVKMNHAGELDFSAVHSINLDEYVGLESTHPQSYRYFMQENLFNHVNINLENTHVPCGIAADAEAECKRYDSIIEQAGGMDLQLLGIGMDGHIGFNEPGDFFERGTHVVTLDPSTIEANARFFDSASDVPTRAMTMGMAGIMQAKKVLMIANGEKKKAILEKALFGEITPRVPASILQLHPDLTVIFSEE